MEKRLSKSASLSPSVYAYDEPRAFLRDLLAHKQSRNRLFSIRAWAQQMGFGCHTSLVFFLSGKRRMRPEHVEKLNRGLRLGQEEEKYFRLLVQRENAGSPAERADLTGRLRLLRPSAEAALIDQERFHLVSDWVHMAMLEMTELSDFSSDPSWISRRLGGSASPALVEEALARLLQLGLLRREGARLVKTNKHLTTPGNRASEAVREHHRQVLALASRAIEGQPVEERTLNSSAFTISTARLPEARELILKFRADMAKLLERKGGDETYELSIQLFRLTTGPRKDQLQ